MNYVPFIPASPPLEGVVEVAFVLEHYSPEHKTERLVPDGRAALVIELDGRPRQIHDNDTREPIQTCRESWFSGVQSRHLTLGGVGPETRLCAVRLAPGRAYPLLKRPLCEFNDSVVPATSVFGDAITELRATLVELEDPAELLRHLTGWLADRYDPKLEAPPGALAACSTLLRDPAHFCVTTAASESGVSHKHLVDLFKRHVGPTPKVMQRILRFAQVFERLSAREPVAWADLAVELGYSDQSHFVREFQAFSGYRPRRFAEAGHERLNFFPDDEGSAG